MVWGVTQSHLVVLVLAGEERQTEEELGDDRAERPHVDRAAWEDGRGVREVRGIAPNCAAEFAPQNGRAPYSQPSSTSGDR